MPVNEHFWHFPLRSSNKILDANMLARQLGTRPLNVSLRAIEPTIVDVCQPYESFEDTLRAAQLLFIRFATVSLALSAHEDRLKSLLRSLGAQDQVTARVVGLPMLIQSNLATLSRIAKDDTAVRTSLESGQVPREGVFADAWRIILDRYGHRAENETDLAAPRYAEQPEKWIQLVLSPKRADQSVTFPRWFVRSIVTFPLRGVVLRYHYARENFRFSTMYAFAHLRNEMLRLADRAAAQGQIEGKDAIWSMTVREVMALDTGTSKAN